MINVMGISDVRNYVLSEICEERRGPVMRNVWLMDYSLPNLQRLWAECSKFPVLFSDEIKGDFHAFCETFFVMYGDQLVPKGLTWVVDDFVGVYYMNGITSREANVDFSFFDKRLDWRLGLTKKMIKYVFDKYKFNRLNINMGAYASDHLLNFIRHLGFVEEGRKRKAVVYKGELFDLKQFGLLREEAEYYEL